MKIVRDLNDKVFENLSLHVVKLGVGWGIFVIHRRSRVLSRSTTC